jgi:uncharacterized membrane protein HdeD (DUF308 family)
MKRHFDNLTAKVGRVIKHWWLMMLAGILCIAAGLVVFIFPMQSYLTLAILFGILMILVGAAQLVIASTSGNYLAMKGYMIAGGILDLFLGLFLCIYPSVTLLLIPIMLGIWLMYHSFIIIAFGGDMDTFRISGSAVMVIFGILLLALSIFVLLDPLSVGVATILILAGIGLMLLGLTFVVISFKLKNIHKVWEKTHPVK